LRFQVFLESLNRKDARRIKRHIIIGKQGPLRWQKQYHGTVSATEADPASRIIGDDFSNMWYVYAVFPLRKYYTEQMFVLLRTKRMQLRNHADK